MRKMFDDSPVKKKEAKKAKYQQEHSVKKNCCCKLQCSSKITCTRQKDINSQFWNLSKDQQKLFIFNLVKKFEKKRNTTKNKETTKRKYSFKNSLKSTKDNRGRHPSSRKIDRTDIINHINLFKPTISHYRREHAPNRKYLPSDITIKFMYKDFQQKYSQSVFYELYRKQVNDLNISFANLGHEECWECEKFTLHEKVIMLPRLDTFKEIIFTPRIIAFNESFVPLGKRSKINPLAVLWHEGVRRRSKVDIISTYYAFFHNNRDVKPVTIWLDNCSSQNKNWSLLYFFINIVNCLEVALKTFTVKYFVSGHTFKAADSFHHQVELSLKRKKRVCDFNDFIATVKATQLNSTKVDVHVMELNNFYEFIDYTSKYKLRKLTSKIYMKDIVAFFFKRGSTLFSYKKDFSNNFMEVNDDIFLNKYKNRLNKPIPCHTKKGITLQRKNTLISTLKSHIPDNRMQFWEELHVNNDNIDDVDKNSDTSD
ncbi:hypothetical protein RN001_007684 [Aquatica leii]|uniref:DUF7869 domain-containing protein n=1 Tax=Aquatica leii TaxID=1421715 RepID=A0AAN7SNZ4_9COLE|nr:hypothetical protein RN001_007684 [Aquatica leii]